MFSLYLNYKSKIIVLKERDHYPMHADRDIYIKKILGDSPMVSSWVARSCIKGLQIWIYCDAEYPRSETNYE